MAGYQQVQTSDGRSLEVLTGGDPDGFPLLYHGGSPSAAVPLSSASTRAARDDGLRLITYSRPGYGDSTVRPRPEPRMADDVADSASAAGRARRGPFVTPAGPAAGRGRSAAPPCCRALPGRGVDGRRRAVRRGGAGLEGGHGRGERGGVHRRRGRPGGVRRPTSRRSSCRCCWPTPTTSPRRWAGCCRRRTRPRWTGGSPSG